MDSIRHVYRIGVGPSSSHTMAPRRAARLFVERVGAAAHRVRVALFGSLAATCKGHLTDRAVVEALVPLPCDVVCDADRTLGQHPNAMRFEAIDAAGRVVAEWLVFSTGGGALADENGPVDQPAVASYPAASMAELLAWSERQGRPLWAYAETHDPDLWGWLAEVWHVMQEATQRGLAAEGVLPGTLGVVRKAGSYVARARTLGHPLGDLGRLSAYALAVAEENAAGGRLATAPTCGAAGVVPAVLRYLAESQEADREHILRALATAGLVGAIVKTNASISGAEVGCQGEVGTACSMAAAAAAQLLGGTPPQIECAAEMAMEHHLGLTCDPIDGLVQIPCIERNAAAAVQAFQCAGYALLGDGRHRVPFDDVVAVMAATGRDMQAAYKETGAGGLAQLHRRRAP